MGIGADFLRWIQDRIDRYNYDKSLVQQLNAARTQEDLDAIRAEHMEKTGNDLAEDGLYKFRAQSVDPERNDIMRGLTSISSASVELLLNAYNTVTGPEKDVVKGAMEQWIEAVKVVKPEDPAEATDRLASIATAGINISAALAATQIVASNSPLDHAEVANDLSKKIITQLGIAAVITAISHDPVKIGVLRPWQDALEQSFRNKRPDDTMIFQAYRTRELAPKRYDEISNLTEEDMKRIEEENSETFHDEMSRHGYADWYIEALGYAARYTPRFNDLMQLGRQGLLTKGLAIYSLWGAGYDELVMKPMLDALMEQNRRGSYEGFRSMIEPAFREGLISEEDLTAYWNRIAVPEEVQDWVMPRLKNQRKKYLEKQQKTEQKKERDLTASQIQQAYQNQLMNRGDAQNLMFEMGYTDEEVKVLLDLAELRRKTPTEKKLKQLSLTDYEKAFKNGLITLEDVMQRMEGEYDPKDIYLERKLLEIGKA